MQAKNTFSKEERLKSRKKLQELFAGKKAVYATSIKLLYETQKAASGFVKCGVGLSGRYFKKAVTRNRIKRQLREAYRQQKHELQNMSVQYKSEINIFILYTGKTLPDYNELYKNVGIALQKLTLQQINCPDATITGRRESNIHESNSENT